jgi:GTP-binding protein YchF
MKTAIIGLPMTGKTSLFTILTGVHETARTGSMETRVGVTQVPDARLEALAEVFSPEKVTHATIEFIDFPSISKESLRDPSYLASLRVADAMAHVVRLFQSDLVPHEKGSVDPARDIADVDAELVLSDLAVVEKRLERLEKDRKKIKDPGLDREYELLLQARSMLENGEPLRGWALEGEDEKRLRGFQFLSQKPILFVLNVGENDAGRMQEIEEDFRRRLVKEGNRCEVAAVCGKIEAELAELEPDEQSEYLASYGLPGSSLDRLVGAMYRLLGLMSFLTAGETEVRAWTVPVNSTALKAAGAIHTDFEKKFIRAEVVPWQALVEHGGYAGVREKGLLRLEGKDYIVKDGDVLVIRHG